MHKRVTCKGGPLNGNRYDIPTNATYLDLYQPPVGRYEIKHNKALWVPTPDSDDNTVVVTPANTTEEKSDDRAR